MTVMKNREVSLFIGNQFYTIEEPYWGAVVPLILALEKPLKKKTSPEGYIPLESNRDAEILKPYVQLRVLGLKLIDFEEHPKEEIDFAAYDILEKPWGPQPNFTSFKDAEKGYAQKLEYDLTKKKFDKEETFPLVRKLRELNLFTLEELDWMNYFHYTALENSVTMLSETLQRKLGLQPKLLDVVSYKDYYHPEAKNYHLFPELLDWDIYLSIRGLIPTEFKEVKYSRILDVLFQWEKKSYIEKTARTYLRENPEAVALLQNWKLPKNAPLTEVPPSTLIRIALNLKLRTPVEI